MRAAVIMAFGGVALILLSSIVYWIAVLICSWSLQPPKDSKEKKNANENRS